MWSMLDVVTVGPEAAYWMFVEGDHDTNWVTYYSGGMTLLNNIGLLVDSHLDSRAACPCLLSLRLFLPVWLNSSFCLISGRTDYNPNIDRRWGFCSRSSAHAHTAKFWFRAGVLLWIRWWLWTGKRSWLMFLIESPVDAPQKICTNMLGYFLCFGVTS